MFYVGDGYYGIYKNCEKYFKSKKYENIYDSSSITAF